MIVWEQEKYVKEHTGATGIIFNIISNEDMNRVD